MDKIITDIFPQMKMSELIIHNPNITTALTRWEIPLGFGEQTVKSVADKYHIHPDAFISTLVVFCGKHSQEVIMEKEGVSDLLHFLKVSHIYFKEKQIPKLKKQIEVFAENIPDKHGKILVSFFDGYVKEVNEHFRYEDETVFPYIESILKNEKIPGYKIIEFEKNHSDIEQKLLDLKNILLNYSSDEIKLDNRLKIFHRLVVLENDIDCHNIIENYILIPSTKHIEDTSKTENRKKEKKD